MKAKMVGFSFITRVVVEDNATEDEVIEAAILKLLAERELIKDNLQCGVLEVKDDDECPYGTFDGEE